MVSRSFYLGFLALLATERLFELWLSRRNAARAFERGGVEIGRQHFKFMASVHTLFLVSCAAEVLLLKRSFPPVVGPLAIVGGAAAQGLRYWAVRSLGDSWNVRIIVVPGAPPITRGPYRFVRHPNYVAVSLELLCVPIIHGGWLTAAAFGAANLVLLRARIPMEEEALGGSWAEAFSEKPRFMPRGAKAKGAGAGLDPCE